MANIVTGDNNFIGNNCDGIALINCDSCVVEPRVIDLTAINCTSKVFSSYDSYSVFIKNAKVDTNRSTTATSSAATTISAAYSLYYVDATAGNVDIYFDNPALYIDMRFFFKRIDASAFTVTFYSYVYGTELLEFAAMPQSTVIVAQGDCVEVTTNGTDWFII